MPDYLTGTGKLIAANDCDLLARLSKAGYKTRASRV